MNQLYGGQKKFALVEVEISDSKEGKDMEIASAKIHYDNPFTKKKETSTGRAYAKFSKDNAKVMQSANIDVQRDYNLNLNAIAQEKAITFSDKGKKKEAVMELKKSADRLRSVGSMYNDEDLIDKANAMESQAAQIEKEGMTKAKRKTLRTDAYQMKNQQMNK
ncbi:MAG: hypothetical protein GY864_07705 [Desulfobacterales bacterium]|nr:hypothetical protein [Desulfobacterales bacterium]